MNEHAMLIVLGYWLFSAIVSGMPEPTAASGISYRWLFQSLHVLAGNVSTAISYRFPQLSVPEGATAIHKETTVVVPPPSS